MASLQMFRGATTSRAHRAEARALRGSGCSIRPAAPARRCVAVRAAEDKAPPFKKSQMQHSGKEQPMSENKDPVTVEQMAAPEGDKAKIGEGAQYLDSGATRPNEQGQAAESSGRRKEPVEQPALAEENEALRNFQKGLGVE